jgi:SAM-dependent methyltransferase
MNEYSFYHCIRLSDEIVTPGIRLYIPYQAMVLDQLRNLDLKGKRVLDVGCRDGLYSFEAERLGAGEVVGIDNDLSAAAVEFLIPHLGSSVRMHEISLYDLDPGTHGRFDLIIFAGVLYHLRYPFWGLRRLKALMAPEGELLIETALWLKHPKNALVFCPTGTDSPYEPTSCTFFNLRGLTDTLQSMGIRTVSVERLSRRAAMETSIEMLGSRAEARELYREIELGGRHHAIDRALFHCVADDELADPQTLQYWDGTHRAHTGRPAPD